MPEIRDSKTQSGIDFQNSISTLYTGRMLYPRPRSEYEQPVADRVEALEHVDDTITTFADGRRLIFQAIENIDISSGAWKKLWGDFYKQRNMHEFGENDVLQLVVGTPSSDLWTVSDPVRQI